MEDLQKKVFSINYNYFIEFTRILYNTRQYKYNTFSVFFFLKLTHVWNILIHLRGFWIKVINGFKFQSDRLIYKAR